MILQAEPQGIVNQIAVNPTVVYASQTVSSILSGQMLANGFNFSYTALPADNNKPLVILLQARPLTDVPPIFVN